MLTWKLHGTGKSIKPGAVVGINERLSWPRTVGFGLQHIAAMFGATFLVPIITGFSPTTTLFFSGVGTLLFILITQNKLPSYLGSSFAFLAPVAAAKTEGGIPAALGGIVVAGILLALVGYMVIGLNLAGAAKNDFVTSPLLAIITLLSVGFIGAFFKGFIGRISIFGGLIIGYVVAALMGDVDFAVINKAAWVGLPTFTTPTFSSSAILLFLPVVLVLIAENIGHVKAVAAMTGKNLDNQVGNALIADGAATALAGLGGGSGTTTYAENIGVMAASRVYSTLAYIVAGVGAILLALSPKFGAVLAATPAGVNGGVTVALFGMIGVLGARIWIDGEVNFADPTNLYIAASALIIGISDLSWTSGNFAFSGIINATLMAVVGYQVFTRIAIARKNRRK